MPTANPQPQLEIWDSGRLRVCSEWAASLRAAGLTTFESLWQAAPHGQIVRDFRPLRITSRIELNVVNTPSTPHRDPCSESSPKASLSLGHAIYLKCHGSPSWRDRLMAWGRFRLLHWGAIGEWDAMFALRELGIPTATPVLYGADGGRSLVASAAVDGREEIPKAITCGHVTRERFEQLSEQIAFVARTLHGSGWHHQDFYLDHFLMNADWDETPPVLLDLHRTRHERRLSDHWRIKDLAQLNFSARTLRNVDRLRWFFRYCETRHLEPKQRRLLLRIISKTRSIESHTARQEGGIDSAAIKHQRRYPQK